MKRKRLRERVMGVIGFYLLSNLLAMAVGTTVVLAADKAGQGGGLVAGLGISVLAAGVTGLVMTGYILITENWRNRITVLQQFGIEDYFHENSTPIKAEYDRRLANHHKQIDVLGLGLSKLRNDFKGSFKAWAAAGTVRILLIDPDYPTSSHSFSSQRDVEENDQPGKIAWDVRCWLEATMELRDSDSNFRIKLYQALPAITMVRIDNEIFWSPYFVNRDANSTPTMLVRRGGLLFDVLSKHFDDIWETRAVTPERELASSTDAGRTRSSSHPPRGGDLDPLDGTVGLDPSIRPGI